MNMKPAFLMSLRFGMYDNNNVNSFSVFFFKADWHPTSALCWLVFVLLHWRLPEPWPLQRVIMTIYNSRVIFWFPMCQCQTSKHSYYDIFTHLRPKIAWRFDRIVLSQLFTRMALCKMYSFILSRFYLWQQMYYYWSICQTLVAGMCFQCGWVFFWESSVFD